MLYRKVSHLKCRKLIEVVLFVKTSNRQHSNRHLKETKWEAKREKVFFEAAGTDSAKAVRKMVVLENLGSH